MGSKLKIMVLIFLFSIYSCGWFEEEEIRSVPLNHGYKFFYDTENIAFNYITILTTNGLPLLSDCEEFFISQDYLYAKLYKNATDYEYYRINNLNKKVTVITHKEYSEKSKNFNFIRYKDLR